MGLLWLSLQVRCKGLFSFFLCIDVSQGRAGELSSLLTLHFQPCPGKCQPNRSRVPLDASLFQFANGIAFPPLAIWLRVFVTSHFPCSELSEALLYLPPLSFRKVCFLTKAKAFSPQPFPPSCLLWCSLQGPAQPGFSTPLLLETSELDGTFAHTLQGVVRAFDELQGVSVAINCSSNF